MAKKTTTTSTKRISPKATRLPKLGAHMSIAGGYYKAVERAAEVGCQCVQVFTKNNNQWKGKELTDDDCKRFKAALKQHNITHPVSHASYLINLASPDKTLWRKSIDAMVIELQRADRLGIPYVVVHPGAFTTSTEAKGLAAIIKALDEVLKQTTDLNSIPLLETTAGQGSCLGWKFEHLGEMVSGVKTPDRVAICFDTCHVFSAGYPMQKEEDYKATMKLFHSCIGKKKIKAFHLNDSKTKFASRVDRHEGIGQGSLGFKPFRHLLNDRSFTKVPMYLETPKGEVDGKKLDTINLRRLRRLVAKK